MSAPIHPSKFRFGLFEIDRRAGELRKNGARLPLQDRPLELLCVLLERPGEVVTRDELRHRLWAANSCLDFDHSINAAVNKVRTALVDSAANPRFIETVGRRGYRFIAPVSSDAGAIAKEPADALPEKTSAGPDALPKQPVPESGAREFGTPHPISEAPAVEAAIPATPQPDSTRPARRTVLLIGAGAAALAAIVVTLRLWPRVPAIGADDRVLVADFVNTTGEGVFDDSLRRAMSVKLAESPYFSLISDFEIRSAQELLNRKPGDRLVPPFDRATCARAGAKALVSGSIMAAGSGYKVRIKATDCSAGREIAARDYEAESADQVLQNMGPAVDRLRRSLGETVATLQKFDSPMDRITTTSLPALKAVTAGDKARQAGTGAESASIPYYRVAIELDPNFASAYSRLCAVYSNLRQMALAREYCQSAYDRRDHVSQREKLSLEADYFGGVIDDYDAEIKVLELARQIYPRDWMWANDLANECIRVGRLDEAVEAARAALRSNPQYSFPYINLMRAYKRANRFAEAKVIAENAATAKLDAWPIHELLWQIAVAENDAAAAAREQAWFKGNPNEADLTLDLAEQAYSIGQVRRGRDLFEQTRRMMIAAGRADAAADAALEQANYEAELGRLRDAAGYIGVSEKIAARKEEDRSGLAAALGRAGLTERATTLVAELRRQMPQATLTNAVLLSDAEAGLAIVRGDGPAALQALRAAVPYDYGTPPDLATIYHRGLAYLLAHNAKMAQREFSNLLAHNGISSNTVYITLGRLGLARALAAGGDSAAARRTYEEFFLLWKQADSDVPILNEARREFERLKSTT